MGLRLLARIVVSSLRRYGEGRMSGTRGNFTALSDFFSQKQDLQKVKCRPLQQAQRMRQSILFVIFLTIVQAKWDFAIAEAFAKRGGECHVNFRASEFNNTKNVNRINVISAQDMWQASLESAVKIKFYWLCGSC